MIKVYLILLANLLFTFVDIHIAVQIYEEHLRAAAVYEPVHPFIQVNTLTRTQVSFCAVLKFLFVILSKSVIITPLRVLIWR